MSKKVVFPLIAVCCLALGCQASAGGEAKFGTGEPQKAEPAPAPPPPPAEPAPPPPEVKTAVLKPLGKAKIENNEIKIPGKVHFEFNKSAIKEDKETKEILETLRDVMKENPSITKLRVEGHTDDKGTSELNHKLSQARAEAVVVWLEKNGVDKARLDMKGLGEERPLTKNDTEPNREQNRRVEFKIWEIDGKPTDLAKNDTSGPSPQGVAASGGTAGGNPSAKGGGPSAQGVAASGGTAGGNPGAKKDDAKATATPAKKP